MQHASRCAWQDMLRRARTSFRIARFRHISNPSVRSSRNRWMIRAGGTSASMARARGSPAG
eukprot:6019506-Pleurochrysis_carterae.AAC.1